MKVCKSLTAKQFRSIKFEKKMKFSRYIFSYDFTYFVQIVGLYSPAGYILS